MGEHGLFIPPGQNRSNPRTGVVYTRPDIVGFALDMAGYRTGKRILSLRVLDVGCGYGQFIGELARRLAAACEKNGLTYRAACNLIRRNLRGIEVSPRTARLATQAIRLAVAEAYGPARSRRDVAEGLISEGDFLAWDPPTNTAFDLVVGNLPYVKYESIDRLRRRRRLNWIRNHYDCFTGRADYSVAFMEKITTLLAGEGRVALITSNRFTQAEYGQKLRQRISQARFDVDEIDLQKVEPFDQKVSAYASLFILEAAGSGRCHYVRLKTGDLAVLSHLNSIGPRRARSSNGYLAYNRGRLPMNGDPWSPLPPKITSLLRRLARRFPTVTDAGVTIRSGPATGADGVFIRQTSDFPLEVGTKARFLLPVFSGSWDRSKNKRSPRAILALQEPGSRQLRPFNGLPDDLRIYLEQHRSILGNRYVVKVRHRPWWGTIDPIDPTLVGKPKLIVPDLRPGGGVFYDTGVWFPSHSAVYALGSVTSLRQLSVVLRSPLADAYRAVYSPALRGGTPRASSRVLSRLPFPLDLPTPTKANEADAFSAIFSAYGLEEPEVRAVLDYSKLVTGA